MNSTPIPLAALGRLNTHARAPGAFFGGHDREAIYAYKAFATLTLARADELSVRLIKWTGRCNRCTNGRFRHWDWDDAHTVACRDCAGTALRTLRFTETTLPDGQVWHHPWSGRNPHGNRIAEAVLGALTYQADGTYTLPDGAPAQWHAPGEWGPNLPATRLPLAELVALLNETEDWVEAAPTGGPYDWIADQAKRHLFQHEYDNVIGAASHGYYLDLGRVAGGCAFCGEAEIAIHFGRTTPLFHWSLPVCAAHRNNPFPTDPPPAALITPDIRRWIERHERVKSHRRGAA